MPVCKNCFSYFPNRVMIDGRFRNLCARIFCLKCSPFDKHNTRDVTLINKSIEDIYGKTKTCSVCKKEISILNFYKTQKMKRLSPYCKDCSNKISADTIRERKKRCIEYKGSVCIICGYDRCINALEFHHIDPTKKEFSVGGMKTRSFKKVKNELDKCILVCSNCHKEIHAGVITVPKNIAGVSSNG